MKTRFYLLCALLCGISLAAHAQLKVTTGGNVLLGGYSPTTAGNAALSLYSNMSTGITRVSFNTLTTGSDTGLDVFVGKYPLYLDTDNPDQLHLHGKNGFHWSSAGGDLMYSTGQAVYFEVDAIGSFYTPSDSRFKKDVAPLRNALTGLKGLSGISYRLKDDALQAAPAASREAGGDGFAVPQRPKSPRTRFGFVAQEVREIYPELVVSDSLGYMYVDYMGVVPLLVNALNELQDVVDTQAGLIEELQNELSGPSRPAAQPRSAAGGSPTAEILPALCQNDPNPFSSATTIRYALPYTTAQAALYIYNMQGHQIRRIDIPGRGEGQVTLQGSELQAGMYIYALVADGKEIDSKRMILTK